MPQKMFRLTDEQICKLKKVSELRGCSQTDLIRGFIDSLDEEPPDTQGDTHRDTQEIHGAERQDAQGTRLGEVILMNVNDFMAKHGITDADLDRMAAPYEDGSFEPEPDGKVFSGSHLDAVGTRRVTVVYDAKDTQRVAMIARSKGVKPSSVYRDALDYYLAAQA